MKKRLLAVLTAAMLVLSLIPAIGYSETIETGVVSENAAVIASGSCGAEVTYTIYDNRVMVIEGSGAMDSWASYTEVPWCSNRSRFDSVIVGDSITKLGAYAFENCTNLKNIKLPDSITAIPENLFKGCEDLLSVAIPDTVKSIGAYAFSGCSSLTDVNIPEGVKVLNNYTFSGCYDLKNIEIPDSVYKIGYGVFSGCGFENITVPDTVTDLYSSVFYNCYKMKSVTLPAGLEEIPMSTFEKCSKLEEIVIPETVTYIGSCAFYDCRELDHIDLPDSVTEIEDSAFSNTAIRSIELPAGLTVLERYVFRGCRLASIIIPESIQTINRDAFDYQELKQVYYEGDADEWEMVSLQKYEFADAGIHYNYNGGCKTEYNAGTCTKPEKYIYTCTCGATDNYEEIIDEAPGHQAANDGIFTDATCITGGYTTYSCSICGDSYKDNITAPTGKHKYGSYATTTKAGFGTKGVQTAYCQNENCTAKKTKSIAALKTPALSAAVYTFNNKAKKPSVTVKNTSGSKVSASVSYASGRKSVGKYAVKVTVNNANYKGTKTVYFKINPAGAAISKVTSAKKAFTVKWKKPSSTYRKQMTGYQIRYSTSSKMTKAKTVTVKSTTATSKKISKLNSKKTYYVQLRTYKKIGSSYYYSNWSKAKKVKTK